MGEIRRPTYTDLKTGKRKTSAVWWIRYYRNGRRYSESSHSTKKNDAKNLLKLREGAIANGEPITSRMARMTFDDAAKTLITNYQINGKRSLADVERRIRLHLEPYFGRRRMASISTDDMAAYVAARQQAHAEPATINRELAIVRRAFRLARQAGRLLHVPYVPMLAERNVRTGFFERDQFEAMRAAMPEDLRGLVTFAYLTGWRIKSEVLPLTWAQVDRNAHTVRLEPGTTKNSDGRMLPYGEHPELVEVIEAQWKAHGQLKERGVICPFVFNRKGQRLNSVRTWWDKARAVAGYPTKIPHDFRRTAVRNFERAGVSRSAAMKITGHKTESIYRRYAIVSEGDLREGLGKLVTNETGQVWGKSRRSGRVVKMDHSTT
jgi:integrase